MKQLFTQLTWVVALSLAVLVQSCDAGVDLGNIDKHTGVKASLALPIGSVRVELGDVLGDSLIPNIGIEDGCYVYRDTFDAIRPFHPVDLSSYISDSESNMNVREHMVNQNPSLALLPEITVPADTSFYVDFIMPFKFNGINKYMDDQRVDSAIISQAHFTSVISAKNLDMSWDEIERVQIILNPKNFRRDVMTMDVPISGYGFNRRIPVDVYDFHLILMEDVNEEPSATNIIDSTYFTMRFYFKTKKAHTISDKSAIIYNMEINFIEYEALFGYFKASNKMRDTRENVPFTDFWSGWDALDGFILPVREPSVFIGIEHTMAIPLLVDLHGISVKSKNGDVKDVSFNGEKSKQIHLPPQIKVTDPLDYRAHDTIKLGYSPEDGNLADVMTIHPDFLTYSYNVDADTNYTAMKQYRIVDHSDIDLSIGVNIPFKFNPGTYLHYADTITDISINRWSLDSLVANIDLIDTINHAQATLFLTIENSIPFAVTGAFHFLDSTGTSIPFEGVDSIALSYPTIEDYVTTTPGTYSMEIAVDREDLHKLADIKAISYRVTLGENTDAVDLTTGAALKIYIGVKADVDAVLDLDALFNPSNTEE